MPVSIRRVYAFVSSGLLVAMALVSTPAAPFAQEVSRSCRAGALLARVPELQEASGIAASRRTNGRFWSHNDSGDPVLLSLDAQGRVTGRLRLTGAKVEDWEAIAVGPCPAGSCIYVADIGDNDAERDRVTIYRVPEPAEPGGTAKVTDVFDVRYPDGAHDAETLLVAGDGRLYIVTKGDTGLVSLYRFPSELQTGIMRLDRVGAPREPRRPREDDRITDGAVSPDGVWVVLRSNKALMFYRAADLWTGTWRQAFRYSLSSLDEPQGEGVTFGTDGALYLASEGGGKKRPGMIAKVTCTHDEDSAGRR